MPNRKTPPEPKAKLGCQCDGIPSILQAVSMGQNTGNKEIHCSCQGNLICGTSPIPSDAVISTVSRFAMMELYDRKSQSISIAKVGRSRKYSHFFGGRLEDYGFKVEGDCPLHLIWLLDAADPLCMMRLRRKHIPLCYGFQFGGCATAYRLNRNTIQILSPLKPCINPDFPYPRYPSHFQAKSITLGRCTYDARNPKDAQMCSAFFGLRHVSQ